MRTQFIAFQTLTLDRPWKQDGNTYSIDDGEDTIIRQYFTDLNGKKFYIEFKTPATITIEGNTMHCNRDHIASFGPIS